MDSLKSLMDKKQYQLILDITNNSTDCEELFYRISAFLVLGKANQALDCLKTNIKILEKNMPILMKVHIEILCLLGEFDEAYAAMNEYKEKPYFSQENEELLKELPNYIRAEEKKAFVNKDFDNEKVLKLLKSDDKDDVLLGLDLLRGKDLPPFINQIKKVLISFPDQTIRTFALLLLIQKQYDSEIEFTSQGKKILVNPKKLVPPFVGDEFNSFIKKMDIEIKNPSLSEIMVQVLSTYILLVYPEKITYDEPLLEALYFISAHYMQADDYSLEERCKLKNLSLDKVKETIEKIQKANKSN